MKKSKAIHPVLKERLRYDAATPDREVLKDWRSRTRHVCKPCWELKYCPYGPLVELSPILPPDRAEAVKHNDYLKQCLKTGRLGGGVTEVTEDEKLQFRRILRDRQLLIRRAIFRIEDEDRVDASSKAKDPVRAFLGVSDGRSFKMPKVDFHPIDNRPIELNELDSDTKRRIETAISKDRAALKNALKTGRHDSSHTLDAVRKMMFERDVKEFKPGEYPEECPEIFRESSCNIFGHICPVFCSAEAFTETSDERRRGRYIPFDVKMRVVRRDNYTCQECGVHLGDNEVEFDHIIPVARGGSSEKHNIRLTCFNCNRDKRDQVKI
jgi:5-methylcytosine-specific restriction endonuclease McrA